MTCAALWAYLWHLTQGMKGMMVSIVHALNVRVCYNNVRQELKVHEPPGKALGELQAKVVFER